MTNNHRRTREWLKLALDNISTVVKLFKIKEYAACTFRIQLSVENIQKALIFLLGMQFKKTHEPSRILDAFLQQSGNGEQERDREVVKKIREISRRAKILEKEDTATRYGVFMDEKLVTPSERYDKTKTKTFIQNLAEIIHLTIELLEAIPGFRQDCGELAKLWKKLRRIR
ncbi:MAG: HEPN domain-containing protein [Promethearchaeota archaeon]